jgi:hypothetical protein
VPQSGTGGLAELKRDLCLVSPMANAPFQFDYELADG